MLSLQIVSPSGIAFSGEVDFVVVPGNGGQLGILPRHAPLFSTLRKGEVKVKQNDSTKLFDISGGFVEVLKNNVTVLEANI